MKKFAFLPIFLFFSMVAVSQVPQLINNNNGNEKEPVEMNNSIRSIPPGTLIYSQPFSCPPVNGISSIEGIYEDADDFILTSSSNVDIVRWWFSMNDDPATTSWVIKIYDNQDCLPSALLGTWNITPADVTYEYVCTGLGLPIYDIWANLTPAFVPMPNVNYWIAITVVSGSYNNYWCEFGIAGDYYNCPGVIKFGSSDFQSISSYLGYNWDFIFELYSTPATPPIETPISNWALGIGIFLIFAVALIRFRKLV